MEEHYRCERVQKFSVLGLRESKEALDEERLMNIIRAATSFQNSSTGSQASSTLFSSPAVQLADSQATVIVSGDSEDPIISILKEQRILFEVRVSSVRKVTVTGTLSSHIVIVADSDSYTSKNVEVGSTQLVVSVILPSKKQAETLIELLEVLKSFLPASCPDSRYLTMRMPQYKDSNVKGSQLSQLVSIYEPSSFGAALDGSPASSVDIYEPSTYASGVKSAVEISKLIEGERAFVAQLRQCMRKVRWPNEIRKIVQDMDALHQNVCILLETSSTQNLIECLNDNLKTISEHSICFDYVSVYGTRSPDLRVDIVTRLCSLRMCLDADNDDSGAEKTAVMDVLRKTIRTISDRQILLQIDQDKFNVMKCGEVMLQGSIIQIIKKKPVQTYAILTRELLILTSPNYLYLTHAITDKITSAIAYKESTTEFVITLEAKVSQKKLHFRTKDCNSVKTWLNCLNYIIKQTVELYF